MLEIFKAWSHRCQKLMTKVTSVERCQHGLQTKLEIGKLTWAPDAESRFK